MNKILMSLLFGTFLVTGTAYAQTPPPAPAAEVTPVAVKPAHREHHQEIHKAMRKLRSAKLDLEKAAHDYAGHRVKAIAAIDQALEELKDALASDKE